MICSLLFALQTPLLSRAHSHNDYMQARPLNEALDNEFNSINGTTQMMSMDNQGKMTWRNFDEHSGALNRGNAGRYEVMAGPSAIGGVVRVDTQSGETWGTNKPANLITAGDLTGGGLKASDLVAGKIGFYKVTFN